MQSKIESHDQKCFGKRPKYVPTYEITNPSYTDQNVFFFKNKDFSTEVAEVVNAFGIHSEIRAT
jgi:hypothetical protein